MKTYPIQEPYRKVPWAETGMAIVASSISDRVRNMKSMFAFCESLVDLSCLAEKLPKNSINL